MKPAAAPLERIFDDFKEQQVSTFPGGNSLASFFRELIGQEIRLIDHKGTHYGKLRAVFSDQQSTWLLMTKCTERNNSSDFVEPQLVNLAHFKMIGIDQDEKKSLKILNDALSRVGNNDG